MKIRENGGRPFANSAVRKQYLAEKISANAFSAIRQDGQFIYRPNAMSPMNSYVLENTYARAFFITCRLTLRVPLAQH